MIKVFEALYVRFINKKQIENKTSNKMLTFIFEYANISL